MDHDSASIAEIRHHSSSFGGFSGHPETSCAEEVQRMLSKDIGQ